MYAKELSTWQIGPDWLRLSEEKWPISQDVHGTSIPDEEILRNNIVAVAYQNHYRVLILNVSKVKDMMF